MGKNYGGNNKAGLKRSDIPNKEISLDIHHATVSAKMELENTGESN
jgi:hypothetical protein